MIVIPMAGISRRFALAGYEVPKYMLQAGGRSLFWHAVHGFDAYFDETPFLFVYRDVMMTDEFVRAEARAMGIADARFVPLDAPTRGQAETVAIGLERSAAEREAPITIFNIDTIRTGFRFPAAPEILEADGYLEVFQGSGANWSFVLPEAPGSTRVVRTTEKDPVSDLCCTGLYHFRRAGDFMDAFNRELEGGPSQAGEFYVAPLYNDLIGRGLDIRYGQIEPGEVVFSGVPAEYEAFKEACGG
jgi:hypothetical protein